MYCHVLAPLWADDKASNPIHLLIFPPATSLSFRFLRFANTWYGAVKLAPAGQARRPAAPGRLMLTVPKLGPGVKTKPVVMAPVGMKAEWAWV